MILVADVALAGALLLVAAGFLRAEEVTRRHGLLPFWVIRAAGLAEPVLGVAVIAVWVGGAPGQAVWALAAGVARRADRVSPDPAAGTRPGPVRLSRRGHPRVPGEGGHRRRVGRRERHDGRQERRPFRRPCSAAFPTWPWPGSRPCWRSSRCRRCRYCRRPLEGDPDEPKGTRRRRGRGDRSVRLHRGAGARRSQSGAAAGAPGGGAATRRPLDGRRERRHRWADLDEAMVHVREAQHRPRRGPRAVPGVRVGRRGPRSRSSSSPARTSSRPSSASTPSVPRRGR